MFDQIDINHKNNSKNIEELSKKYEIIKNEQNNFNNENKAFKIETNEKISSLDENLNKFINLAKKDISDTLSKFELVNLIKVG